MASLLVLNGPNLNLLGLREPAHYGSATPADVEALCQSTASEVGMSVKCAQSNHEGVLIDHLHAARTEMAGVVLNAGGYTHTSVALRDAVSAIELDVPFGVMGTMSPKCSSDDPTGFSSTPSMVGGG